MSQDDLWTLRLIAVFCIHHLLHSLHDAVMPNGVMQGHARVEELLAKVGCIRFE